MLLQRSLLYTGVTRGKKLVVIVGARKAMAIAVKNNKMEKRSTLLKYGRNFETISTITGFYAQKL